MDFGTSDERRGVSLDVQWGDKKRRVLAEQLWADDEASANAIILNDDEARELTGRLNLPSAMEEIQMLGPSIVVVKKGEHVKGASTSALNKVMKKKEITIIIGLGLGKASAETYTCDLSYDYVRINAEYTT